MPAPARRGVREPRLFEALERHFDPDALLAEELVPDQPGFCVVVDGLLYPSECSRLIKAIEDTTDGGLLGGTHLNPPSAADLKPRKNEALLARDSCAVVDKELAARLWERLHHLLPIIAGGHGPARAATGFVGDGRMGDATPCQFKLYRYVKGHVFGTHVDVSRKGDGPGEETEYTMLVYLNSSGEPVPPYHDLPLTGGDTVYMATAKRELCRFSPRAGAVLLHAHGKRCLPHFAEEVSKGAKYVLRADVMYAPAAPAPV